MSVSLRMERVERNKVFEWTYSVDVVDCYGVKVSFTSVNNYGQSAPTNQNSNGRNKYFEGHKQKVTQLERNILPQNKLYLKAKKKLLGK